MLFWIGQLLLWVGFLSGALVSVWSLEVETDKWSTIHWGYYGGAALVAAAGAGLLQWDKVSKRTSTISDDSKYGEMSAALTDVTGLVDRLAGKLDAMTCEQVVEYIDDQCMPRISDFVEWRHLIANRHGNLAYAKVMTEFASGERYLNRVWSAAADGYVDEVRQSVEHSRMFLAAAGKALAELGSSEKEA